MDTASNGNRRRFLQRTAAIGASFGGVVVAAKAQELPLAVPPWSTTPGLPLSEGNYGAPSPFEKNVVRRGRKDYRMPGSGSIMSPLGNLRGTITPNGLVFERSHGGVPEIDPAQHRLVIHGLVRQPLIFTMEDIVRFPSVSRIHFMECSGNTSQGWMGRPPSVQLSHGLLSACEWTGVMLSTVLDEAGLAPNASWIIAEGADAAGLNRSVPIAKCLEDAMLVYAQNGEALRPENGYPLRLFLPGWEGNMSVKWLRRIRVTNEPAMTRWETASYTESMPDGTARQFTFVMEAKSVITHPAPEKPLAHEGLRGDQRYRMVRQWPHQARRRVDGWRAKLAPGRASGADTGSRAHPFQASVALERRADGLDEPRDGRDAVMSSRRTLSSSRCAAPRTATTTTQSSPGRSPATER